MLDVVRRRRFKLLMMMTMETILPRNLVHVKRRRRTLQKRKGGRERAKSRRKCVNSGKRGAL